MRALVRAADHVFAGLDAGGILRSEEGGRRWTSVSAGLPDRAQVFDLAALGREIFAALYSKGVYRLRIGDGEERWVRAGDSVPLALAISGKHVVAGHNPGGLLWTMDLGQTWLPTQGEHPVFAPVWAMAGTEEVVLAGVADGMFRSEDQGRTWVRTDTGLPRGAPGIAFHIGGRVILAAVTDSRQEWE